MVACGPDDILVGAVGVGAQKDPLGYLRKPKDINLSAQVAVSSRREPFPVFRGPLYWSRNRGNCDLT